MLKMLNIMEKSKPWTQSSDGGFGLLAVQLWESYLAYLDLCFINCTSQHGHEHSSVVPSTS
jgi:hypothetical protein